MYGFVKSIRRSLYPLFYIPFAYKIHFMTASYSGNLNESYIHIKQHNANIPIQDRISNKKLESINGHYIAVFDGHGGYTVSEIASVQLQNQLEKYLQQNLKLKNLSPQEQIKKSLTQSFIATQNMLETNLCKKDTNKNNLFVGSCALVGIVTKDKVYIANAGDSQGIIVNKNGSFVKTNRRLNAAEKQQQQRLTSLFPGEKDIIVCNSPTSCYVKGCLQPTYSLGDFVLKKKIYNYLKLPNYTGPYIEHRPQIKVFDIKKGDKYVILATDGLWDQFSHNQINDISLRLDENNLSNELMKQVFKKIRQRTRISEENLNNVKLNRRRIHDDISFIVLDLQKYIKQKYKQ